MSSLFNSIIWANDILQPAGLSFVGLVTALGTIIASFFSARFGAAESRRQFRTKGRLEKLVAAAELSQLLHAFEQKLQDAYYDVGNWKSSSGQNGGLYTSLASFKIDGEPHKIAATLGERVLERVMLLLSHYARARSVVSGIDEHVGPEEAGDEFEGWAAALIVETYDLINLVNRSAGIRLSATPIHSDDLIKAAGSRLKTDEYTTLHPY